MQKFVDYRLILVQFIIIKVNPFPVLCRQGAGMHLAVSSAKEKKDNEEAAAAKQTALKSDSQRPSKLLNWVGFHVLTLRVHRELNQINSLFISTLHTAPRLSWARPLICRGRLKTCSGALQRDES